MIVINFKVKPSKAIFILLFSCVMLFSYFVTAFASPAISEISVVMDDNYPPYIFKSGDELRGVLIDEWNLWEKKTGVKVNLVAMDWNVALEKMEKRQFDVVDTAFETDERAKYLDFDEPYVDIDVPIFFRNTISGITDAKSLEGFVVGVKGGDASIEYLHAQGIDTLVEYESYEKLVIAAKEGQIVTFVADELAIVYLLYKYDINKDFNFTEPLYTGQFHRAVAKGNTETLNLVAAGFAKISANEYKAIQQKWFGQKSDNLQITLKGIALFGILIAGIATFLIAWNRSLKNKVREKTHTIMQEVGKTEQSNRRLNAIISSIPDLFFIIDKKGVFLDFCRISGK